ncbi:MAG: hypothetical protein P8X68_12880 [Desulfobacterales bacterium]
MPSWQLEVITPEDLNRVLTIDYLAFKRPWNRNLFLDELSCDHAFNFSVRYNQTNQGLAIIAYVFCRMVLTELHIIRIAVAQDFRTLGVATWLLRTRPNYYPDSNEDALVMKKQLKESI